MRKEKKSHQKKTIEHLDANEISEESALRQNES